MKDTYLQRDIFFQTVKTKDEEIKIAHQCLNFSFILKVFSLLYRQFLNNESVSILFSNYILMYYIYIITYIYIILIYYIYEVVDYISISIYFN